MNVSANASDEDCKIACSKSIILSSPQKFLNCLKKNLCNVQNLILLIVLENSKISKCAEYQQILDCINFCDYRLVTFMDPAGMNSKIIKQVIEMFDISKVEVKNVDSPEVRKCTFRATIESILVDVSQHILNIKDAFFSVFEKYGKKLKDAKVINGNVAGLTRGQVQKAKEKFLKNPPSNLSKTERDSIVDSMTMCAFLCHGIELLHNWGVRAFYQYLFDSNKEDDLKSLMRNDEHLAKQMSLLDECLKPTGKTMNFMLSGVIHPKILTLKNTISEYFSDTEDRIDKLRIVVLCPVDSVIVDIERLFSSLPDCVRCQCVKTKAKCLSSDPLYKETIENFLSGVINLLVVTNLVEEILQIKTSLIISLEPIRLLFTLSNPKFYETTEKCLFILTRGVEENKFRDFLNEKNHEQKPLNVNETEMLERETSTLFPRNFDPEFECTSVREPKKALKNSPGQKSIHQFFSAKLAASSPGEVGTSKKWKNVAKNQAHGSDSPSLFADDFGLSDSSSKDFIEEPQLTSDSYFEDPLPYLQEAFINAKPIVNNVADDGNDSFDDLILDFTTNLRNSKSRNTLPAKSTPPSPSLLANKTSPILASHSKFSWTKRRSQKLSQEVLDSFDTLGDRASKNSSSKAPKESQSRKSRSCDIGLDDLPNVSFVDDLFSSGSSNSEHSDDEKNGNKKKNNSTKPSTSAAVTFTDESFGDFIFSEKSTRLGRNEDIGRRNLGTETVSMKNSHAETSSRINLNNNDTKIRSVQKAKNYVVEDRPDFDDNEDDLFDDVSWLDGSALSRKCDTFAKYRTTATGDGPLTANVTSVPNTVPTHEPKSMSAAFESSSDFSRLKTIEENSARSCIPDFSLTEISSEIFDDFVPASPPRKTWPSSATLSKSKSTPLVNRSPILFSSKKTSRKRLSSGHRGDDEKSTSVDFDSFFDLAGDDLKQLENGLPRENVDEADEVKVIPATPPRTQYEFDSIIFDEEILNNITAKRSNDKVVQKSANLDISSTSPSLFDLCQDESTSKTNYIDATVTVSRSKKLETLPPNFRSPVETLNSMKTLSLERTNTLIRDVTPKNKMANFRRRSTPLFNESNNNFGSPSSSASTLRPALQSKIAELASSNIEKKKRLFSNFAASVKEKLNMTERSGSWTEKDISRVEDTNATMMLGSVIDASDDNFPWLKKSSSAGQFTPCFKKPEEPPLKSKYFSHSTTPTTITDGSEVDSSPRPIPKLTSKKRSRLKRNLAKQFIDAEAEVTDDNDDEDEADECSHSTDDSFIDDETSSRADNMSKYLKSIKSPAVAVGKFRIPMLSERHLNMNVYSQAVEEHDQAYENDSFCVDEDDSDLENTYLPSVLTQMEEKLSKREERKIVPKLKQFKRIRIIEDSSPDSPAPVCRNRRKRIKCFSSDSED